MSYPLIISYFTENTIYENEIQGLKTTCVELKLKTDIEKIVNLGSWEKNCLFKPSFILKKLKEHKRSLLWVDSDAVFLKKPNLLKNLDCDIALKRFEEYSEDDPNKFFAGTIFFNYNDRTLDFVKRWADFSNETNGTMMGDQETFKEIFKKSNVNFFNLPSSYSFIFDLSYPRLGSDDIVILHFQASRFRNIEFLNFPLFFKNLDPYNLKLLRQKYYDEVFVKNVKKIDSYKTSIKKYKFLIDMINDKFPNS